MEQCGHTAVERIDRGVHSRLFYGSISEEGQSVSLVHRLHRGLDDFHLHRVSSDRHLVQCGNFDQELLQEETDNRACVI